MHLVRSCTRWMFQKRVPLDLVHILGRNPIRLALKVSGALDARRLALRLAALAESEFDRIRHGTRRMDIEAIVADESIDERDKVIAVLRASLDLSLEMYADSEKIRKDMTTKYRLDMAMQSVSLHKHYGVVIGGMTEGMRDLKERLERLFEKLRKLKDNSPESRGLLESIQKVLSEMGEIRGAVDAVVQRTEPKVLPLLSEGLASYLAIKKQQLKPNEIADSRYVIYTIPNAVKAFIAYAGDRAADQYLPSELEAFVVALGRLPANWTKLKRFYSLPLVEAGTLNARLPEPYKTLSEQSIVRGYITPLKGAIEWICRQQDVTSPFALVKTKAPKSAPAKEDREPLSLPQLTALFKMAGGKVRPDDRWLPLLGYLTGARMGELVYLQAKDIKRLDQRWTQAELEMMDEDERPSSNPWLIDLGTDIIVDGRRVRRPTKNTGSRRIIALNQILDDLGFIAWAKARKGYIFDALHTGIVHPSSTASKRMARLMDEAGIKVHGGGQDVFHCLRHNCKDWLRDRDVPERTVDRQVGHAAGNAGDKYGSKPLRPKEVCALSILPLPERLVLSGYRTWAA